MHYYRTQNAITTVQWRSVAGHDLASMSVHNRLGVSTLNDLSQITGAASPHLDLNIRAQNGAMGLGLLVDLESLIDSIIFGTVNIGTPIPTFPNWKALTFLASGDEWQASSALSLWKELTRINAEVIGRFYSDTFEIGFKLYALPGQTGSLAALVTQASSQIDQLNLLELDEYDRYISPYLTIVAATYEEV